MIAIKDMEMPKSCSECPFKANDYVCGLLDYAFSCNRFKERNYNCPLVEIITCKDCRECDGGTYYRQVQNRSVYGRKQGIAMFIVKRFTKIEYLAQFLNERTGMYKLVWAYKTESEIVVLFKEVTVI